MRDWKMQDVKNARVENAELKNAEPKLFWARPVFGTSASYAL